MADLKIAKVTLSNDPIQTANNINKSFGGTLLNKVDALVDGDCVSIYPTDKEIRFLTGGQANLIIGTPADQVLDFITKGLNFSNADQILSDSRLNIAIELFRAYYFERSTNARFLTLVMVLEAIAPKDKKHKAALDLLSNWTTETLKIKSTLSETSEEYHALESLERELFFRQDASLRSSIRRLVLENAGIDYAKDSVKIYDLRSKLVHDGAVDQVKLGEV